MLRFIAAFVQLYPEATRYLHRIYKWVAKLGPDWSKARITGPENRRALLGRFILAQSEYQAYPMPIRPTNILTVVDLTMRAAERPR